MQLEVRNGDRVVKTDVDDDVAEAIGSRRLSLGGGVAGDYVLMHEDGKRWGLHRWIMRGELERTPNMWVDHKDRNKLNNLRANLRLVDPATSALNRSMRRSKHGVGVTPGPQHKTSSFQLRVKRGGVEYWLGSYSTKEAANAAREEFLAGPLTKERAKEFQRKAK